MRYPEPILTTDSIGDAARVTARYETPEIARMMASLRSLTAGLNFVGLAASALWALSRQSLSNEVWVLGITVSTIAAYALALATADALFRRRFFARALTDTKLIVTLDRRQVTHAGIDYPRGGVLRFTAQAHREGRHEERDERIKERLMPTTYREAYQVWLQHGEAFMLLANVSDEQGAVAIARRLQENDEQVTRGQRTDYNPLTEARPSPA
jgi:hypothetical protein